MRSWKSLKAQDERILLEIQNDLIGENEKIYFGSSIVRYKHLLSFFKDKERGRVLDLGCSPGHNTMILTKLGFDVIGIDLNKFYLKKYNPNWLDKFNLIISDVEKVRLPFEDNTFNYVIFTEVLEHIAITNPVVIFNDIHRVLKPGGLLYLSTPNVANWSNLLSLLSNKNIFWSPEIFYGSLDRHNREYTSEEVIQMLHDAGFAKTTLDYYNCHSNWNSKLPKIFHPVARMATEINLLNGLIQVSQLNNTIVAFAQK